MLLHLARGIFEEQTNLEKLVQKVMLDAQDLLKCEKCCVYLLEDTCERVSFTSISYPLFPHLFDQERSAEFGFDGIRAGLLVTPRANFFFSIVLLKFGRVTGSPV